MLRFRLSSVRAAALGSLALALGGCEPGLPECDAFLAERIVYYRASESTPGPFDGRPMYEGQALVQLHCASNATCHSDGAAGSARHGAPFGLDFDLSLACESGPGCDPLDLARLAEGAARVAARRHTIAGVVASGDMPPGGIARELRDAAGEYVAVPLGSLTSRLEAQAALRDAGDELLLPRLDPAGRDVLRNWLACGAPVIASTSRDAVACPRPGVPCPGSTADAPCVCAIPSDLAPPAPTFTSIFETLLLPVCGSSCHGPGPEDLRTVNMLDLSDRAVAYAALVGVTAAGEDCSGMGTRVVAGDPDASLLLDKLEGATPSCGASMPYDRQLLPPEFVAPIRQWIAAGALDN